MNIHSFSRFLFLALGILLTAILPLDLLAAGKSVKVGGYHRKDGTYVRPHYRSAPNRSVHDNWSTKGNVNPYTGAPGTRDPQSIRSYPTTPAYSIPSATQLAPQQPTVVTSTNSTDVLLEKESPAEVENSGDKLRIARAERLKSLGHDVDWTQYSASELLDFELRIRAAQKLKARGCEVVWEVESLERLEDRLARIEKADAIGKWGVEVNWRAHSLEELIDIERRIILSDRLKKLGKVVDWEKHSSSDLAALERRVLSFKK